jgi:hypothetical protein
VREFLEKIAEEEKAEGDIADARHTPSEPARRSKSVSLAMQLGAGCQTSALLGQPFIYRRAHLRRAPGQSGLTSTFSHRCTSLSIITICRFLLQTNAPGSVFSYSFRP